MNRIARFAVLLFGMALLLASCEKAPFVTMTGPRNYSFTRDGGTQTFAFSCNRDWSVSSSESWIRVSPSSGKAADGDITVTITCSPNTTYDPRTATITVKVEELMETISVSQDTGLGLIVSPTTFGLTNDAQVIEVEVQQNVNFTIEIDEACKDWIKKGGTKALTTDKVTFTVSANTSYDSREGKIVFKQNDGNLSQTITVKQSQTDGLIVGKSYYELSRHSQTLEVEVDANVDLEVTPAVDWVKYVETKALSHSTICLTVDENSTTVIREGTVVISKKNGDLSQTITIKQAGCIASVSFDKTSMVLNVGTSGTLAATVKPDDALDKTIIWTSSNETVAAVVDGVVTAVSEGDAIITAEAADGSGAKAECAVSVKVFVSSIALDHSRLTLHIEHAPITLSAVIKPDNATDKTLIWNSSDESVVKVVDGTLSLVNPGKAVVTASAKYGDGVSTSCQIVVYDIKIPEAVDLGLSVKWASFSIGASSPEDYGVYYAWGETEPKEDYSYSTYKYKLGDGSTGFYSKYIVRESQGTIDNKTVLDPEDDVAHVKLGGNWRMPTVEEQNELRDKANCTWERTTVNGVGGYKVMSKIAGYEGNSIFLPYTGYYIGKEVSVEGQRGDFLSSSLYTYPTDEARYDVYILGFGYYDIGAALDFRYYGTAVRAVTK